MIKDEEEALLEIEGKKTLKSTLTKIGDIALDNSENLSFEDKKRYIEEVEAELSV